MFPLSGLATSFTFPSIRSLSSTTNVWRPFWHLGRCVLFSLFLFARMKYHNRILAIDTTHSYRPSLRIISAHGPRTLALPRPRPGPVPHEHHTVEHNCVPTNLNIYMSLPSGILPWVYHMPLVGSPYPARWVCAFTVMRKAHLPERLISPDFYLKLSPGGNAFDHQGTPTSMRALVLHHQRLDINTTGPVIFSTSVSMMDVVRCPRFY